MKSHLRKKCSYILVLLLFISFLCGCARETEEEPAEEPMDISIAYADPSNSILNDDVQTYIEKKFNIRFVPISMPYDTYSTMMQQRAVQNDLPDIFTNDILGTSVYESWIQEGKIRSLPKDLSRYPNLEEYLSTPYIERFRRSDGFFYMIPRMTYNSEFLWCLDRCIMVRRDWMETLGLDIPQNWEEFEAMLSAFVYNDPDGNGLDDTAGLTAVNLNTLETVYLSLFPELSNTERGWIYENNQWMPVYNSANTAAALQKLQDLQRKGLLGTNILYTSETEIKDDFITGKSGAICMQYLELVKYFAENGILDKADDYIMIIPPWPADDGIRYHFTTSLHWSELYFSSDVSDEKMEKLLELMDWLLSDEFEMIRQYGLEGIDWEYQDDSPTFISDDAIAPMMKYPSLNILGRLVEWNMDDQYETSLANIRYYGEENLTYAQETLEWYQENTQRVNYNYDIIFMSTPAKNNLPSHQVIQQKMYEIILGQEDALTAWPKALEQIRAETPLEDAIAEVTEQAEYYNIVP